MFSTRIHDMEEKEISQVFLVSLSRTRTCRNILYACLPCAAYRRFGHGLELCHQGLRAHRHLQLVELRCSLWFLVSLRP